MLTLNMTSGNNNQTIWVLKINTPTPIYLSTRDITLDAINYDGQVLNFDNYLTDITQTSTIPSGGGTGAVSSFGFSISRYVGNTSLDGFFNEFYPATSGVYLSGVLVQFGIVWEGATTEAEITWLMVGRIVDYQYEQRKLNITVFQESEITNKEVPYYSVQKDFNNDMSYYLNAPTENLGLTIPIVYGSFNVDTFDYDLKKLCPSILIDKRYFTFIQASHKLKTQNSPTYTDALYKYISGLDTYLVLIPDNGSSFNYDTKSYVNLLSTSRVAGDTIKGKLFIVPKAVGTTSDYVEIENILDRDNSTEITVTDTEEVAIRSDGEASTSDVGVLGLTSTDVQLRVTWQSDDGGNRQITLKYYNEGLTTPAYGSTATDTTTVTGGTYKTTSFSFGISTTSKSNSNLPWTVEELCNLSYVALNSSGTGATSGDINISQVVVILSNIIVSSLLKKVNNVRPLDSFPEI